MYEALTTTAMKLRKRPKSAVLSMLGSFQRAQAAVPTMFQIY